jgi:hypothetical protein
MLYLIALCLSSQPHNADRRANAAIDPAPRVAHACACQQLHGHSAIVYWHARAIVLLAPTHERRVKTLKERASANREERLARRSAIAALHGAKDGTAQPKAPVPNTARRFDWRRVKAALNALIQRLPRNAQYLARLTRCD